MTVDESPSTQISVAFSSYSSGTVKPLYTKQVPNVETQQGHSRGVEVIGEHVSLPIAHTMFSTFRCLSGVMNADTERSTKCMAVEMKVSHKIVLQVLDKTEAICRSFLWARNEHNRGLHLVNWDVVCGNKNNGGLGLRRLRRHGSKL